MTRCGVQKEAAPDKQPCLFGTRRSFRDPFAISSKECIGEGLFLWVLALAAEHLGNWKKAPNSLRWSPWIQRVYALTLLSR